MSTRKSRSNPSYLAESSRKMSVPVRKMFRVSQGSGLAAKMIYQDLDMKTALMRELKEYFIEGISKIENTTVHGLTDENSAPHIISVGFAGIRSEVLLHTLEDKGIGYSFGFSMCFQPSGDQRSVKGNRCGKKSIWTLRSGSVCLNLPQEKKLTIHWKHYIIVYRC